MNNEIQHGAETRLVTGNDNDRRLDNYLIAALKGVPKRRIYKGIRGGEFRVNGGRAKANTRVFTGDKVRFPPLRIQDQEKTKPFTSETYHWASRVLFESDDFLIIDKPSGVTVQGEGEDGTDILPMLRTVFAGAYPFLQYVHRLDKETSGCLLLAKNRPSLLEAQEAFKNQKVKKTYQALVTGHNAKPKKWRVDAAIKRQFLEKAVKAIISPDGKAAQTEFEVIMDYGSCALLQARPKTGRTHQIRVHLKSCGMAIAGDRHYGQPKFNRVMSKFGCKRLFLHAWKLSFKTTGGYLVRAEAPLPSDIGATINTLTKNDQRNSLQD